MNLDKYIDERLKKEGISKEVFWEGYEDFKIGAFIKEAREEYGITQEELAKRIHTTKSVISRMENHSEDMKISTLEKVAKALGKKVKIAII
ncbi:MAG: helix-turn-helix domain-containing protein [Spirochaetaceae bacterium]|jgi:HTH-type transcriptional regulator/antitoxin HipB|nr:helix-turn-helix domain-containing protein [Spirochaetaceae bacterium]